MINEFGKRIWSHITKPWTADRSYNWVDRIIVIDESNGRRVIEDVHFSTFDLTGWLEWDKEHYDNHIRNLRKAALSLHE